MMIDNRSDDIIIIIIIVSSLTMNAHIILNKTYILMIDIEIKRNNTELINNINSMFRIP